MTGRLYLYNLTFFSLIEDENLKQLLHFVVDDPPEDEEETLKYKYVVIIPAEGFAFTISTKERYVSYNMYLVVI